MRRKKQAESGKPIGTWTVTNGVVSVMGITVVVALAMPPTVRDLHVVELWAGVASIAGAVELQGCPSIALDLNRCPGVTDIPGESCEDITTLDGFKKAIMLVLRLCPGRLAGHRPRLQLLHISKCQPAQEKGRR